MLSDPIYTSSIESYIDTWTRRAQGWRLTREEITPERELLISDIPKRLPNFETSLARQHIAKFLSTHGWPGYEIAGSIESTYVVTEARFADDLAFQKECLQYLQLAVAAGQADKRDLAFLTDAVLKSEGRPQIYVTALAARPAVQDLIWPISDPAHVDQRRLKMGLSTLSAYEAYWTETFAMMSRDRAKPK